MTNTMQASSAMNQKQASQAKKSPSTFSWLVRLGLSLLVLAGLIYVLPTEELSGAFARVQPFIWCFVLIMFLTAHATAAFKWWLLVDAGDSVSYFRSVRAHFAGLLSNLCLPGVVGGDVVRAAVLFGEAKDRSRVVFGSLTDRLVDSMVLLMLSLGGFIYLGSSRMFASASGSSSILIAVATLSVLSVVSAAAAQRILPLLLSRYPTIPFSGLLEKLSYVFNEIFARPGKILIGLTLSLVIQSCFIGMTILLARMIGLNISPAIWFFAWPLAKLIAVLPISLGGLGVREAGLATLMSPFGAPAALVVATSLLWQCVLFAGGAVGGLVFLMSARKKNGKDMQEEILHANSHAKYLHKEQSEDQGTNRNVQSTTIGQIVETSDLKTKSAELLEPKVSEHIGSNEISDHRNLKVAILGGGPAGAAAALSLSRSESTEVMLLERNADVGGNASSFNLEGIDCDYGSHRLHPVADPRVLSEIKSILGDDLLLRPRHGRIHLQGRWIHFPLKPLDLLLKLPKSFTFSLGLDTIKKFFPSSEDKKPTFASVLRKGLGPTMSEAFYYPYVRKLWGLDPEELSVTLAHKRVSGSSVFKILQKVARQIPGLKTEISGKFYYPRGGFGRITRGLTDRAVEAGTDLKLNTSVEKIIRQGNRVTGLQYVEDGKVNHVDMDTVWSTLPISMAVRMMDPPAPDEVLNAANQIKYRGMILIYLILETDQFTEFDAHYFPELSVPISRMSEPKNYSASAEPKNRTVLCAELPCDPKTEWQMSDDELGQHMCQWLESIGLPVTVPVIGTQTRRLNFAYPVYDRTFEEHFDVMDQWLSSIDGFLTYGRQGLFAHDNTHHAMLMAYAAVECLRPDGSFDRNLWDQHRISFESHVVED